MTTNERLLHEFGYIPTTDEKWCIWNDMLIVAHPDQQPRFYRQGCNGIPEVIELRSA